MTIVQINTDIRIVIDPSCTTIERLVVVKRGKRAGEDSWTTVGYYASLVQACESLIGRHFHMFLDHAAETASLGEVLQVHAAALLEIRDAVAKAGAL